MSVLVYLHGTNGSGKSTLARELIAHALGQTDYVRLPALATDGKTPGYTTTRAGLVLLGRYRAQCGGVDLIAPYRSVRPTMEAALEAGHSAVFAEGLITPGVETCKGFASLFKRAVFIMLDTPEEQCVRNMLSRRVDMGKANVPYDPANLYRKAKSARAWVDNLDRVGLESGRLQYPAALAVCKRLL